MPNAKAVRMGYCKCMNESHDAIFVSGLLVEVHGWIKKSGVHSTSEVRKKGDRGELVVNSWMAEKMGWI